MSPSSPTAAKAREILEWCRHGHRKMIADPTGLDWVLVWAGTIALLRAVGHVLDKEDAKSDARLKNAQSAWWERLKASRPEPRIFWEFIDADRNFLLKQAELTVAQNAMVRIQGVRMTMRAGDLSGRGSGQESLQAGPQPPPAGATYSYNMSSGHFAGRDPRDLVREAIDWWEQEMEKIEQGAAP